MNQILLSLEGIKKSSVLSSEGEKYSDFRRDLKPKYLIVYRDLFLGYLALFLNSILVVFLSQKSLFCGIFFGSIFYGFFIAYIHLFIHEAAHYNLHRKRKVNDLISDILIGSLLGLSVKSYRESHWKHHLHLGETNDTEFSYFKPLDFRFIIEGLFGLSFIKVLNQRSNKHKFNNQKNDFFILLIGLVLNLIFLFVTFTLGYWEVSLSWLFGMFMFFPFFGSLRQLLEHRDEMAISSINYHEKEHGKVSRLFGDNFFERLFGGAGFNKHLLHHWDPQISYTRLSEVEQFLLDSNLSEAIKNSKTTYIKTFSTLYGSKE